MKALIIYDNFAFAAKATQKLQQATLRANVAMRWNIRPWRLDTLGTHHGGSEALKDAVDARIIVFAGHRTQSLPPWLNNWLERWVISRQIEETFFAVTGGEDGDALIIPTNPELSHLAAENGITFVIDDGSVTTNEEKFFACRILRGMDKLLWMIEAHTHAIS